MARKTAIHGGPRPANHTMLPTVPQWRHGAGAAAGGRLPRHRGRRPETSAFRV